MDTEIQTEMHRIYELLDSLATEVRRLLTAKTQALQTPAA